MSACGNSRWPIMTRMCFTLFFKRKDYAQPLRVPDVWPAMDVFIVAAISDCTHQVHRAHRVHRVHMQRTEYTEYTHDYTCSAPSAPGAPSEPSAHAEHRVHRVHRVHQYACSISTSIYQSIKSNLTQSKFNLI